MNQAVEYIDIEFTYHECFHYDKYDTMFLERIGYGHMLDMESKYYKSKGLNMSSVHSVIFQLVEDQFPICYPVRTILSFVRFLRTKDAGVEYKKNVNFRDWFFKMIEREYHMKLDELSHLCCKFLMHCRRTRSHLLSDLNYLSLYQQVAIPQTYTRLWCFIDNAMKSFKIILKRRDNVTMEEVNLLYTPLLFFSDYYYFDIKKCNPEKVEDFKKICDAYMCGMLTRYKYYQILVPYLSNQILEHKWLWHTYIWHRVSVHLFMESFASVSINIESKTVIKVDITNLEIAIDYRNWYNILRPIIDYAELPHAQAILPVASVFFSV